MSYSDMKNKLESMLSESFEEAKNRRLSTLTSILGSVDDPFVLFGAGRLGRKVLPIIRKAGLNPVAFIDNNPRLWGSEIDGVKVLSPLDVVKQYAGSLPNVVVTVWSGELSDRMDDRLAPLKALGFDKIALFGHLAWMYPDHFLPHYSLDVPENVIKDADSVRSAFDLMADDASRELFINHIRWRLYLDYDVLPPPSDRQIYFDAEFTNTMTDEVYYDIGAFDGDTVKDFISTRKLFKKIEAFEPSQKNYGKLLHNVNGFNDSISEKIGTHHLALGDDVGLIGIESDAGPASRAGVGSSEQVSMTTLDQLLSDLEPPTFIKMDIEGFEPKCLAGGRSVIEKYQPVLAVCVYHLQDHIWQIPLQINKYNDGYKFYLCPHLGDGWDLVLYAVPESRLGKVSGNKN